MAKANISYKEVELSVNNDMNRLPLNSLESNLPEVSALLTESKAAVRESRPAPFNTLLLNRDVDQ